MPIDVARNDIKTRDEAIRIFEEEAAGVLARRSKGLEDFMTSQWPNERNSGPHADGKPSVATGTSSEAITVEPIVSAGTIALEWGMEDGINPRTGQDVSEYYKHVHFTGGPDGGALDAASRRFFRETDDILDEIITAAMARL